MTSKDEVLSSEIRPKQWSVRQKNSKFRQLDIFCQVWFCWWNCWQILETLSSSSTFFHLKHNFLSNQQIFKFVTKVETRPYLEAWSEPNDSNTVGSAVSLRLKMRKRDLIELYVVKNHSDFGSKVASKSGWFYTTAVMKYCNSPTPCVLSGIIQRLFPWVPA